MQTNISHETATDLVKSSLEHWQQERALRIAAAPEEARRIKDSLFPVLRTHGIAEVRINYDGYGDDGNIETVTAVTANGEAVDAESPVWDAFVATTEPRAVEDNGASVREAIDEVANWLLDLHCESYEDGEGGFGEIRLDVLNDCIGHEHSQRRIETDDESFTL